MANEIRTYGDQSIVTSVQEMVELLTPTENFLYKNLRRSTARAMVHQWQDDTLDSAGSGAAAEYVAFSPDAGTTPTLRSNVVMHELKSFSVTTAQRKVSHYNNEDAFSYQATKAMKSWTNKAEFDLLRSSLVSGVSATAPRMNGVIQSISTNSTAHASGTVFSESILLGLLQLTWDGSNGDTATDLLVGAAMKRRISAFSTGITKNVNVGESLAGQVVQVYESDFGTVKVHLHRYIQIAGTDATARIVGMNVDKYYVAQLNGDGPEMVQQAVRATSTDAIIEGYLTLENRLEASSFFSSGFLLTA